jgi:hypothetical protein
MNRRLLLSIVSTYAACTWASMAHLFLGVPDIGPVVGPTLFAAILLAPWARRSTRSRALAADDGTIRSMLPG